MSWNIITTIAVSEITTSRLLDTFLNDLQMRLLVAGRESSFNTPPTIVFVIDALWVPASLGRDPPVIFRTPFSGAAPRDSDAGKVVPVKGEILGGHTTLRRKGKSLNTNTASHRRSSTNWVERKPLMMAGEKTHDRPSVRTKLFTPVQPSIQYRWSVPIGAIRK